MLARLPANWYPDPGARHDVRFWDGATWTDHVASRGVQSVDPLGPEFASASLTLLDEPSLTLRLKKKPFEVKAEYAINNGDGAHIGDVRELERKLADRMFQWDSDRTRKYRFEVVDAQGQVILLLSRPARGEASPLIVHRVDGTLLGQVAYATRGLQRTRFELEYGGMILGSVTADKWWMPTIYRVEDTGGNQIASIALEPPLKPEKYSVRIHERLPDPLRSLVFGAVIGINLALHRKHNGIDAHIGGG